MQLEKPKISGMASQGSALRATRHGDTPRAPKIANPGLLEEVYILILLMRVLNSIHEKYFSL